MRFRMNQYCLPTIVGRIGFLVFTAMFGVFGNSAPSQAASCTITSFGLTVEGGNVDGTKSNGGCTESAQHSVFFGVLIDGSSKIDMSDGFAHVHFETTRGSDAKARGNVTDNIRVALPGNASLGQNNQNIGNINYNLQQVTLAEKDTATFSASGQPNVMSGSLSISTTINDFFNAQGKTTALDQSGVTPTFVGTASKDCNSVSTCNDSLRFGQSATLKNFASPYVGLDFSITITISGLLATDGQNNAKLDVTDPLTFELLDANGQVIPGVTFIADDGFVFGAPVTATPIPAALPLFAAGLGALSLLGWRRKRKIVAA
jgi:hypothetical protein